ncbi:precorrin-6A synthase (deacetylating) [uncultured Roseobacter sp.]|uniref:precorrin-6A synthase (deacetylating) n=1 Tax=uncultured Roseobacter sp. TaxID=114847 RepID=UPI00261004CA|nr:precorrin-6A synthase (deacetylating) [uncultured Roseobacter sp.]
MIKDLWLVGIGTGSPVHLTLEGRSALRDAAAILLPRKGPGKDDLATLRASLLASTGSGAAVLPFDMPVRDESLPYLERVERWHDEIAEIWQQTLRETTVDGPVALMVWGDPGLYDSTLRIAQRLTPVPALRVVPGITALQALTAAHAVPFNTIDGAVTITTGQQLRENGMPVGSSSVFVMLDGQCSFRQARTDDCYIWWGAFLGMPEQVTLAGPVSETADQIVALRAAERARHGWIMDTYLLRRPG